MASTRANGGLAVGDLATLVARVRDAFVAHREEIDELNVFPVPDGDTGTNLLLTVRSVCEAIGPSPDESGLPDAIARAALMGARGNSGVIFSQVLRGLAEAVKEAGSLDVAGLADAFERARGYAYDAVADPVEGTILTVIGVAADRARALDDSDAGLEAVVGELLDAVHEAVQATTDQLAELREAGVVDAGARGFEVFLATLHDLLAGGDRQRGAPAEASAGDDRRDDVHGVTVAPRESGSDRYRFEVQYLLDCDRDPAQAADELRRRLSELGDSVVVVSAGEVLNVHVHTNDIGGAIEAGTGHGRPSRIEVTEFAEQLAERRRAPGGTDEVGIVAVLPGPGLRPLAEQHGATVVDGAAGDLPSVADLLAAVGASGGDRVVVLPGHRNVVPTASQAARVSEAEGGRPVDVVTSADSPPAVLAALAVLDPAALDLDALDEAAAACTAGEVVAAVRAASTPIGQVAAGQFLAVVEGDVVAADDDPVSALVTLARACEAAAGEVVTVVVGADVDDDERAAALAALRGEVGDADLEVIDGRQRPARYLLGVE